MAQVQVALDRERDAPLYQQLFEELRRAVLEGRLSPGTRLPSTRDLAESLRVSRKTVLQAFEMLAGEGYVEGRVGSGTWISDVHGVASTKAPGRNRLLPAPRAPAGSRRRRLVSIPSPAGPSQRVGTAFTCGVSDLRSFPHSVWRRLASQCASAAQSWQGLDPLGYAPLRERIALYLRSAAGLACRPEQVVIVNGTQQALDILARTLLEPGDTVGIEEPGYMGARGAFAAAGARVASVPVDSEGANPKAAAGLKGGRALYLTPSHQFPLGVTMSGPRRRQVLEWAHRRDAWIIEDDYDGDFAYGGRTLVPLAALNPDGRVVYVGTFSNILFPSLRLGYMVLPGRLVKGARTVRLFSDLATPLLQQMMLAEFMREGHFARYLQRMRRMGQHRLETVIGRGAHYLAGRLHLVRPQTGLSLVGWLPAGTDDKQVAAAAIRHGVEVVPLSQFYAGECPRPGLLLGFGGTDEPEIEEGMQRLQLAFDELRSSG